MKKLFLLSALLLFIGSAFSAQVDTLKVFSPSMQKDIKTVVILPEGYQSGKDFPVVYLLHGYGDTYAGWVDKAPIIKELADQYSLIIVCPDGGKGSWYWDSPIDKGFQYETFVAKELVDWVDDNYKTLASREGRAITGLSMGGHGALYVAFKHQDVFGAAGSTAGGVDIRPFPKNWDMEARLGSYAANPQRWDEHTVINMLHLLTPNSLQLIVDCGTSDFFNLVNVRLHEEMLSRNIEHMYISQPGAHNWDYWRKSIPYQLLFMSRFFEKGRVGS
jgi:S-formylglutathione hydrolase FrmB